MAPGPIGRILVVGGISLSLWLIPTTAGGNLGHGRAPPRHVDDRLFGPAASARGDSAVAHEVATLPT